MITAPGAPLSGLAAPLSTPPRPSPNHQTPSAQATEAASATRNVGRNAMPRPSSSWTVAKTVFTSTWLCKTRVAFQVIGRAMTDGLPVAVPPIIWVNPLPYMNDWYCSKASRSQMAARPSCSVRLASSLRPAGWASVPGLPRHTVRPPATTTPLIATLLTMTTEMGNNCSSSGRECFSKQ